VKSILTTGGKQIVAQLPKGQHPDCASLSGGDKEHFFNVRSRLVAVAMAGTVFAMGGLLFAVSPAFAQGGESLPNKVAVGLHAAAPAGNAANLLASAPPVTGGFKRLFQAYSGPGIVLGVANKRNAEITDFGILQGGNHEFTMPLGSLIYTPELLKRIDFSGGRDAGYFRNSGDNRSGYSPTCYGCTSPGGWGDGLTTRSYPLGTSLSLWVGSTIQYAGPTNGLSVSSVLANNTTDRWNNIALAFGFTF
jgi:hypothetical protein